MSSFIQLVDGDVHARKGPSPVRRQHHVQPGPGNSRQRSGYAEIFQVGEALDGKPLIDHQHPHDLFMQLAATWRVSFGESNTSLTLAGGPAGEPTLGPVAFSCIGPSAGGFVLAPLGHHTFDSTHISFGVLTASVKQGRWTFEGSVFNGREPDERRWDFDFGAMDSVAGRVWFRPADGWEAQVSTGLLRDPEELTPGDAHRTTASLELFKRRDRDFKAVTIGYGVNAAHGEMRHGVFGEMTIEHGANSVFGRFELQQVETSVLLTGAAPDPDHGRRALGRVCVYHWCNETTLDVARLRGRTGSAGGVLRCPGGSEDLARRPSRVRSGVLPAAIAVREFRPDVEHANVAGPQNGDGSTIESVLWRSSWRS